MTTLSVKIPVLETERLRLRPPQESDLPELTAFLGSDRAQFVGGPMDASNAFRSYCAALGHWVLRGYGFWLVADKETDAPLGRVGFLYGEGWHEPELGWQMFAAGEGRGMAFEAAKAARIYGATRWGLDGVISYIAHDNLRSRALVQRLGCTLETDTEFLGRPCEIWRHPKGRA